MPLRVAMKASSAAVERKPSADAEHKIVRITHPSAPRGLRPFASSVAAVWRVVDRRRLRLAMVLLRRDLAVEAKRPQGALRNPSVTVDYP